MQILVHMFMLKIVISQISALLLQVGLFMQTKLILKFTHPLLLASVLLLMVDWLI